VPPKWPITRVGLYGWCHCGATVNQIEHTKLTGIRKRGTGTAIADCNGRCATCLKRRQSDAFGEGVMKPSVLQRSA
jgi:hypothetical protein